MTIPAGATRTPVLQARGLVKRYGHVTALDGADLDLMPGEILAVIGDNGAGKSTLVKTLSGMPHVFEVADRIHIARLGRRVAVVNPREVSMTDAVAIMTGAA